MNPLTLSGSHIQGRMIILEKTIQPLQIRVELIVKIFSLRTLSNFFLEIPSRLAHDLTAKTFTECQQA